MNQRKPECKEWVDNDAGTAFQWLQIVARIIGSKIPLDDGASQYGWTKDRGSTKGDGKNEEDDDFDNTWGN